MLLRFRLHPLTVNTAPVPPKVRKGKELISKIVKVCHFGMACILLCMCCIYASVLQDRQSAIDRGIEAEIVGVAKKAGSQLHIVSNGPAPSESNSKPASKSS